VTTPPDAQTKDWIASVVHPRGRVTEVRRLKGGVTAAVHAIRVQHPGGPTTVVARRWVDADDGAHHVRAEARILEQLGLQYAPELIDTDEDALSTDFPALVMSRLPGSVVLGTDETYLRRLAAVLPEIHQLQVDAPPFEAWEQLRMLPEWAERPDLWEAAFRLLDASAPPADVCFVHRDFQHFNVLWSRGRLTGVVDWVYGSQGSPDVDVAHQCLNLALLQSVHVAERFRLAYQAEAGRHVDPWWELRELVGYLPGWGHCLPAQVNGAMHVDQRGMPARVEELLEAVLQRC
jgi:aminoglycoside phosphotransferase (APT) family kinase protein